MLASLLTGRPTRAGGANAVDAGAGSRARGERSGGRPAGGNDASLPREEPARKSTPVPR
ncbi:hypothetical protein [Sorangium sp. So ce124]|uniref:hypothetical protein n=1 Tax=Sorangium sp. So ce124 TaxID=3133280 RepID=UPI003F5E9762